jgi:hypothetical protein
MPKINVNLTEVESSGFPILPDGLFHVAITDKSKVRPPKPGKSPSIMWIAEILDGEFEGKLVSWITSLQEDALWNLKGMLEKIPGVEWDEDGFEMEDVFDKELFIKNKSGEEYNNRLTNSITGYFSTEDMKNMPSQEEK